MTSDPAPRRPKAMHWVQWGLFQAVELLLRVTPLDLLIRLGRMAGLLVGFCARPYRRLARQNMRLAFGGEMSEGELRALLNEHFARLGGNLLAGFKLPLLTEAEITKRVTAEGISNVTVCDEEGANLVYAVCHLSCWELLTQVPSLYTFQRRPGSIYQPLANPLLNRIVLARREKLGYRLFDRSEGFVEPMKFVKEGGCLGVLVDQHAGDHGVWAPFFGRLASTSPLAALLARRGNAKLLPIFIQHHGLGRWKLKVLPPIPSQNASGKKLSVEQMTARLNQVVERQIREEPADWFWVHNRWKTPNPNFLIQRYHRGTELPEGFSADQLKPFELIVRSPNWLGDACMAFPAVRAFKRGRPDLRLTIFGPEKLRDLWLALPEVDSYIGKADREGLWAVAKRLRESGRAFDAGVLLTNSTRSTLEFWLAGIPRLAGYAGSLRVRLLSQVCPGPKAGVPPWHHADKYLRLAVHAGADGGDPSLWESRPGNPVQDEGAQLDRAGPVLRLGLCAGAEYGPAKRWPLERYAAVANAVSAAAGHPVEWWLFGAPGEVALGEKLAASIQVPSQNRVGKTRLGELIDELRNCTLLLSNDTGTMHLAAALGVPTIALFGSTEPSLTGPLGQKNRIIRHHVPCSPCFKRECPLGHYDCMTGISVERVTREVLAALAEHAAPSASLGN